jgi:osmotically-inducible protein OsmY
LVVKQSVRNLGVAALVAVAPTIATASASHPFTLSKSQAPTFAEKASLGSRPEGQDAKAAEDLASAVKARLDADPELKGSNLTVTAAANVVTLRGTLASPVVRLKAVEITKATQGVGKVVNKINIKG